MAGSCVLQPSPFYGLTSLDLSSEFIPIYLPRDQTFSNAGPFVGNLPACHGKRLEYQPNYHVRSWLRVLNDCFVPYENRASSLWPT